MLWKKACCNTQQSSNRHSKLSALLKNRLLFTDWPIFNDSLLTFLSSHKWGHELFISGSSSQALLSNEPLERPKWESTRCTTSSKSSSSGGMTEGWHQFLLSFSPSPKPRQRFVPGYFCDLCGAKPPPRSFHPVSLLNAP